MSTESIPVSHDQPYIYRTIPGGYALPVPGVADNLRAIRGREGLTQEQVAERGHLKQSAVSKYERGKSKPDLKSLLQLAVGLGYDVNALAEGVYVPYDQLCHSAEVKRAPRQEKEETDVPASARKQIADLERRIKEYQTQLSEVQDVAHRLVKLAALGSREEREAARVERQGGRRHRKTG